MIFRKGPVTANTPWHDQKQLKYEGDNCWGTQIGAGLRDSLIEVESEIGDLRQHVLSAREEDKETFMAIMQVALTMSEVMQLATYWLKDESREPALMQLAAAIINTSPEMTGGKSGEEIGLQEAAA